MPHFSSPSCATGGSRHRNCIRVRAPIRVGRADEISVSGVRGYVGSVVKGGACDTAGVEAAIAVDRIRSNIARTGPREVDCRVAAIATGGRLVEGEGTRGAATGRSRHRNCIRVRAPIRVGRADEISVGGARGYVGSVVKGGACDTAGVEAAIAIDRIRGGPAGAGPREVNFRIAATATGSRLVEDEGARGTATSGEAPGR